MPSFADILTKAAETVERPPLAPKGTYTFAIISLPKKRDLNTPNFKGEVIDIPMRGVSPTDDVDLKELKEYGDPKNIVVRKSFLFNSEDPAAFAQTEFQFVEFLTIHLGQDPKLSIKELMNTCVNKKCLGILDYRPNAENPEQMFHDLKKTAPLE